MTDRGSPPSKEETSTQATTKAEASPAPKKQVPIAIEEWNSILDEWKF
jgi:hypothetical protein